MAIPDPNAKDMIAMTAPLTGKRRVHIAAEVAERFIRDQAGVHELAKELGRRPAVVRHLLAEAGICMADVPCIGVSDEETAATLARRYSAGASIAELVRLTGLDKRIVRKLLVLAGVSLPERHSTTGQEAQRIIAGYRTGASIRTLAADTGFSYSTAREILVAHKVPLRPRGAVCAHSPAGEPTDADKATIAAFAEFLRATPRLHGAAQATG